MCFGESSKFWTCEEPLIWRSLWLLPETDSHQPCLLSAWINQVSAVVKAVKMVKCFFPHILHSIFETHQLTLYICIGSSEGSVLSNRAATNDCFYYSLICRLFFQLTVCSIEQGVIKYLVLSDQQSKPDKYSIHYNLRKIK